MASPGNDTDVKIASKAVAIKSNTRLKKLVGEGDLLKMKANKKKRKEMSARKTCSSGYLPRCNGASQTSAPSPCFKSEKQGKEMKSKSNGIRISLDDGSQPFVESRAIFRSRSLKVFLCRLFVSHD